MAINFTSKSRIENLKKLAEGGEATIYEYDTRSVIKVYKAGVDLAKKEQKVKFFIQVASKLLKNVIGPQEIVTVNGKFAGYLMKKLVAAEDLHMLTKPKFLAAEHLTNQDVLRIVTSIGRDLATLHSMGIVVGDVSDYNFQISGKSNYFIDVDSWGVDGRFSPDAYTEMFTCPDSYNSNGSINFSIENENYNFAVLAFNMLTRIHPFGGTYLPNKDLSMLDRMKQKISIVGKRCKDIKIPKIIGSWKWMSPQLEKTFVEIFEQGKKADITPELEELLRNMKYCRKHDIYYYSMFSECPLCNENAKVSVAPVIAKVIQTANGPQITIVFGGRDCTYVLSGLHYLNMNGEAVHFESGRKFKVTRGKRVDFSSDGNIVFVVDDDTIEVYDRNDKCISNIERMHKSNYLVKDRELYYIDKGSNLVKLSVTERGNLPTYFGQVYNPIFEASEDGKVFCVSMYPKVAIAKSPEYTFEISYSGRIKEYAIKYDKTTKNWLFVYLMLNGRYRTMVFNKNQVVYDSTAIMYNAQTLSNIDFCNNTIYDPADGMIIGTNIIKNIAKEFRCDVVDESSRILFTGRGFKILGKSEIYNYG